MEDLKETLINEVQKYPALWDTREKDFKDADQKKNKFGEKFKKIWMFKVVSSFYFLNFVYPTNGIKHADITRDDTLDLDSAF